MQLYNIRNNFDISYSYYLFILLTQKYEPKEGTFLYNNNNIIIINSFSGIINADDYGLTINVSKAIILGLKKGILTDTNAIVNTPDFKASAEMAQSHGIWNAIRDHIELPSVMKVNTRT